MESLQSIVRSAVNAPSGHNFQPWRFRISSNVIEIYNIPEADQTILNYKQRGSYFAHGALIENIRSAAHIHGYEVEVVLFPDQSKENFVARITCIPKVVDGSLHGKLASYIELRSTQRGEYSKGSITDEEEAIVLQAPEDLSKEISITLVRDRNTISRIAQALSVSDWLIFNNIQMHSFVFDHLVWDEGTERQKRSGLYLETLALEPPVKLLFNFFKYWRVAHFLGRLGFGSFVAAQNATKYAAASAIVTVNAPTLSPRDLVLAGERLQYLWLKSTMLGYSMQPILGVLYLSQRLTEEPALQGFDDAAKEKIKSAGSVIRALAGNQPGEVVCILRFGKVKTLSVPSSKKLPDIEFF